MGLRDLFRRTPKICAPQQLAAFVDRHAAFLVQKGIFEYSRARAGHFAKVMFNERAFLQAVEVSRWRAYPLGLAMVGEVVEGVLRPHYRSERGDELAALSELVLSVFDRYPEPPVLAEGEWAAARAELARRLGLIGLHPVKRVIDIPEPLAKAYFDLMPIHERLRGRDFPTMRNYLKIVLCNVHDELTSRLDAPALVDALLDTGRA
ncbi:MAG TPA: hypothetical protein VNK52_14685 [Hyphomicrobiaceae bacterium]|nr:hypothetical protein [Hyphomicrobiaceae bacterium]